jgi:hypothetical protein
MSKNKQSKPKPIDQHEAVHTDTMSPLKRWTIIGIAVFCLLIFSVTTAMSTVLKGLFSDGPPVKATLQLPSGPRAINLNDYRSAVLLKKFAAVLGLDPYNGEDGEEEVLSYATLMLLSEDLDLMITTQQIQGFLAPIAQTAGQYKQLYRSSLFPQRFSTAQQFESQVARALRVFTMVDLLKSSEVPTEAMVFESWAKDYEEMDVEYTVWHTSQFEQAAVALEPSEEELNTYFEEELSAFDRVKLEIPQAVTFETVLLSAAALETDAVKAWFTPTEPTEEELNGFYQINKQRLYVRPELEDGQKPDPEQDRLLSLEELGDSVRTDYLLNQAMGQLGLDLMNAEDVAAFAAERGAEYLVHDQMVEPSELMDIERIGNLQLNILFQSESGTWSSRPLVKRDLSYYVRTLEKRERSMPELAEIRDDVVALWRSARQITLAEEAADAFVAALPRGEDYVEGDPVSVSNEVFANAVAESGRAIEQMGWVSRRPRRTVDPLWPTDATILRGLRSRIGFDLENLVDGQIVGPENFGEDGIAVAHLKGRRPVDAATMWPSELTNARARAGQAASAAFVADQLSFEGLATSYGLTKVIEE